MYFVLHWTWNKINGIRYIMLTILKLQSVNLEQECRFEIYFIKGILIEVE